MRRYIIVHTASLCYWQGNLDDRIHAILDAGADGVELSYGPSIIYWKPARETILRLRDKLVTLHAEIYNELGITLDAWTDAMKRLPWQITNATFHPNELYPEDLTRLLNLPFPISIENMDIDKVGWRTPQEIKQIMMPNISLTLDVNHAEENGIQVSDFYTLPIKEVHVSVVNKDYYINLGYKTKHAMTQLRPDSFPVVPTECSIIVIEGLVPPDMDILRSEIDFVRDRMTRI